MASKASIRLLLILALILAAHSLKPLSGSNFAEHLLGAAGSLTMILPDAAANRIVQANYLAAAFGRSPSSESLANPTDGALFASNETTVVKSKMKARVQDRRSLGSLAKTVRIKSTLKPIVLPAVFPLERALAMSFPVIEASFVPMSWAKRRMPRISIRPVRLVLPPPARGAACEPATMPDKPRETTISTDIAPTEAELFLNDQAFEIELFSNTEVADPVTATPPVQECENEPREVLFEPFMPVIPMH